MMRTAISLVHFEWLRLSRSPMRAAALVIFFLCGLYAIGSGAHHVEGWKQTLSELQEREKTPRDQALKWFEKGRKGPKARPRIDVTQPSWADRYASAHAAMVPEPLAALAIGLSDVRSSWAAISASGSRPFTTSDPATLGNAEKLLAGNFDLAFVLAYLMPLLLLVLLFDVGGLERDLGMMRMVRIQAVSPRVWLIQRILLPVLVVAALVALLCVIGGFWTGAIDSTFTPWLTFSGLALAYTLLWGALFGAVISAGTGVSAAALWMVGLWLGLCVVVPAGVRQFVGQEHPSLYASELTTALRAERYEILLGDVQEHEPAFYEARPELPQKPPARANRTKMQYIKQAAFLDVVDEVTGNLTQEEVAREAAVARFGWVNPAYVLQRALCVLAGTESVNYRSHRQDIFDGVTARLETLVEVAWSGEAIDQSKFTSLFEHGPYMSYGRPPEPGTQLHLLGLAAAALVGAFLLATLRGSRERRTGI